MLNELLTDIVTRIDSAAAVVLAWITWVLTQLSAALGLFNF